MGTKQVPIRSNLMKTWRQNLLLLPGLVILGILVGHFWRELFVRSSPATGQKVVFYQDSMHPWIKSDRPGKCTICSMDLTPIFEGQAGFSTDHRLVVLSSNSITVLNVQTTEAKRQRLQATLRVAGTLEANEARRTIISAPAPCQIQAVMVEYAGVEVEQGQPLLTLFSPELVQKSGYFRGTTGNPQFSPVGLTPPKDASNPYSRQLAAPKSGVVVERNAYVGQYVPEGEKLLTIVDASVLWFRFDVYERQLPWLAVGQKLNVIVPAVPGKIFPAVVKFIEPTLNELTRTVKVRAELDNPVVAGNGGAQRLLRFGMYADGRVLAGMPDVLTVPRTAILFPGGAAYAYVDRGNGAYERRRVRLGRQGDEFWEVLDGLEEGDRVVIAGNVLIDAQAEFNRGDEPENPTGEALAAMPPSADGDPAETTPEPMATGGAGDPPAPNMERMAVPRESLAGQPASPPANPPANSNTGPGKLASAGTNSAPAGALTSTNRPTTRAALSSARMAFKEEMRRNRMSLIAAAYERGDTNATPGNAESMQPRTVRAASEPPPKEMAAMTPETPTASTDPARSVPAASSPTPSATNAASLSPDQRQALQTFVTEAGAVSQALAADDLAKFNQQVKQLATVVPALQKELAASPRWQGLVERLAGSSASAAPAKDLAEARKWFLPFSTASVELVKQLRKQDSTFAGLEVYHCPMAPKPGLWMQSQGPLANPFYGAKMLTCGEEVKP
jgi:Cu(I)/Ag(I) efflux system membrane fusion protein